MIENLAYQYPSTDYNIVWSDSNIFSSIPSHYSMEVKGKLKNILTDALAILASKSKNITEEKLQWAQKVVDIYTDIEYHKSQLEKLNKEFNDLEKS